MWCYWKGKYYLVTFFLEIQAEKTNVSFAKTFSEGYFFVFVEYLRNRSSKMRTKHFKNYISILVFVNYRNWLAASSPSNIEENVEIAAYANIKAQRYWNVGTLYALCICLIGRPTCVPLVLFCFAILQLMSAKFYPFTYNSRTFGSSSWKLEQQQVEICKISLYQISWKLVPGLQF